MFPKSKIPETQNRPEIILDGNLNNNLTQILSQICLNLQKQYDISPKLINRFINSDTFLQSCGATNEKYSQMLQSQFQKIEEIAKIESKPGKELDENNNNPERNGWEGEKCGYLIKEYPNGFKKYCNQHKYLHTRNIRDTRESNGVVEPHEFIFKTQKQIIEEKTYCTKLDYYQEYLNKLLELLQDHMTQQIKRDYSIVRIKVEDVLALNEWLKTCEDCFKTKFILSLVMNSPTQKYEYGNYIDIFLPNSRLEKYLKDIEATGVNYVII